MVCGVRKSDPSYPHFHGFEHFTRLHVSMVCTTMGSYNSNLVTLNLLKHREYRNEHADVEKKKTMYISILMTCRSFHQTVISNYLVGEMLKHQNLYCHVLNHVIFLYRPYGSKYLLRKSLGYEFEGKIG